MIIRRAIADDVPKIAALEAESFTDPWSEKDIFSIVCSEGGMCFTALEDDGELIAYVFGRLIAPEGEIYRIAVRADKRQRGVGYRLLSFALKTERGRGLETTFLEVRSKNIAAISLYRAHGFEEVGRRTGYYQNPADDAIIMLLGNAKY
jgi:ribosomal-protein-alanine N-acetyltransferase